MESMITAKPSHPAGSSVRLADTRGLALAATLLVVVLMSILTAVGLNQALSSVRSAGLDYHEARAFYAAEAGVNIADMDVGKSREGDAALMVLATDIPVPRAAQDRLRASDLIRWVQQVSIG